MSVPPTHTPTPPPHTLPHHPHTPSPTTHPHPPPPPSPPPPTHPLPPPPPPYADPSPPPPQQCIMCANSCFQLHRPMVLDHCLKTTTTRNTTVHVLCLHQGCLRWVCMSVLIGWKPDDSQMSALQDVLGKNKRNRKRRRCKAVNQRVARGQPFCLVRGQPSFFSGSVNRKGK